MATSDEVRDKAHELWVLEEARRYNAIKRARRGWTPPELTGTLATQLKAGRVREEHLIDGLMGVGHNVSIAGQYKTGKTTLGLNVVRSLVDGVDFLGHKTSLPRDAVVCWINGEMTQNDFLDYAGPMGIKSAHRVRVLHMRGGRLPLLDDHVAKWVIKWLQANKARVWVIDSWRRACVWSGVNENLNPEVEQLTDRIDWIKEESGVREVMTLAHTGRGQSEQGEEHQRGATSVDDWVDQRWVLTRQQDARYMFARGRTGDVPEFMVQFNPETHVLSAEEGNRSNTSPRLAVLAERFGEIVRATPGIKQSDALDKAGIRNKDDRTAVPKYAADVLDIVHWRKVGTSKLYYPVGEDGEAS